MKKNHAFFASVALLPAFFLPIVVGALVGEGEREAPFREFLSIPASLVQIKVPTVIELPLDGQTFDYPFFEVKDTTEVEHVYVGNYFHRSVSIAKTPLTVLLPKISSAAQMVDGDYQTYASFGVPENGSGSVVIELGSGKSVTASTLSLLLESEVALPNTILIQADTTDGLNSVVLNTTRMSGSSAHFPRTSSSHWKITLTYSQPLRITELQMNDSDALRATTQGLRFLALPGHSYKVYANPDRAILGKTLIAESGDLYTDKGVVRIRPVALSPNLQYVILDTDRDTVPDISDNCVSLANPSQEDVNQNEIGDICEDFDRDGVVNAKDNCPSNPNVAQTDTDGDKAGDACDKEESRITEANAWLPWVGMGFALLVVVVLVFLTMRRGGLPKPEGPTPPIP